MKPRRRLGLTIAALAAFLAVAIGGSYALTGWEIARSQRQWCDTLSLLTSQPVSPPANPSANPSRVGEYRLYEDFLTVRGRFCG